MKDGDGTLSQCVDSRLVHKVKQVRLLERSSSGYQEITMPTINHTIMPHYISPIASDHSTTKYFSATILALSGSPPIRYILLIAYAASIVHFPYSTFP